LIDLATIGTIPNPITATYIFRPVPNSAKNTAKAAVGGIKAEKASGHIVNASTYLKQPIPNPTTSDIAMPTPKPIKNLKNVAFISIVAHLSPERSFTRNIVFAPSLNWVKLGIVVS